MAEPLLKYLAERVGFEPTRELFTPYTLSRRAPSATRSPLQHNPFSTEGDCNIKDFNVQKFPFYIRAGMVVLLRFLSNRAGLFPALLFLEFTFPYIGICIYLVLRMQLHSKYRRRLKSLPKPASKETCQRTHHPL